MSFSNINLLAQAGKNGSHFLLYLVATVCTCEAKNHLQFFSCTVHKLLLKGSLLGSGGPGQPFIKIQSSIHAQ
jgi:hypothetical protein